MENALWKVINMVGIIALGFFLKRIGVLRREDSRVFTRVMLYVTLPGVLINSFRDFQLDSSLVIFILIGLVSNILLMLFAIPVSRRESSMDRSMYMLAISGFNGGSFCIPFVQSFFPGAVLAVVMFDIGNTIMSCGTTYSIATSLNSASLSPRRIARSLVTTFMFDFYITLFVLSLLRVRFPQRLYDFATVLGNANTVVAMLMLGVLFEIRLTPKARQQIRDIVVSRVAVGAVLAAAVFFLLPLSWENRVVAAMLMCAPMTSMTTVYCQRIGNDPDVYGTATSLTIALSVVFMGTIALAAAAFSPA